MLSRSTIRCETDAGRLFMTGDASLIKTMERWLYHRKTDDPSQVRTLEEEAVEGAGGTRPIAARNYAEI